MDIGCVEEICETLQNLSAKLCVAPPAFFPCTGNVIRRRVPAYHRGHSLGDAPGCAGIEAWQKTLREHGRPHECNYTTLDPRTTHGESHTWLKQATHSFSPIFKNASGN